MIIQFTKYKLNQFCPL